MIGEPGRSTLACPPAVWKTTNAGATWWPIFDNVKDAEVIGAVEVAPSNGNTIYVGTGDLITGGGVAEGNGMYKSTDAGATWMRIGLEKTKQIPSIVVDPRDANVVLVAAQGDVHTKNDSRGVYRSTDGGSNWTRTLFVNDSTGIQKLAIAFDRPNVVFATTVRHYTPPSGPPIVPQPNPPGGAAQRGPTGTSIYKSVDGGVTWKELSGRGLLRIPGRTSIAVAIGTDAQRVFLISNVGLLPFGRRRRELEADGGGRHAHSQWPGRLQLRRVRRSAESGRRLHVQHVDVHSSDGGKTFTGFRGAPGGDDPQQLWIDPTNGKRILLGYDQGAIVTLDGGATWSSWYNQSTEQIYHVAMDNSFPYWVYAPSRTPAPSARAPRQPRRHHAARLESGARMGVGHASSGPAQPEYRVRQRQRHHEDLLSQRAVDQRQPGPDPSLRLRANSTRRCSSRRGTTTLLAGFQYLMSTSDGGAHWTTISPNLGYPANFAPPPDSATPKPGDPNGGTIMSIGDSTVARGTIWVGTNSGLVKVTRDNGRTWSDASDIQRRGQIHSVKPSNTNAAEAYVTADARGGADYNP